VRKYSFLPDRLITDDLQSYGAAARELGIEKRHERGRSKNNRAEAARFTPRSTTISIRERHLVSREVYKQRRSAALAEWRARGLIAAWVWTRCAKKLEPAVSLTPLFHDVNALPGANKRENSAIYGSLLLKIFLGGLTVGAITAALLGALLLGALLG
jgi:hypothetical protein